MVSLVSARRARISVALFALCCGSMLAQPRPNIPRTADGKPNLQGIWQVRNRAAADLADHGARNGMPPGLSVIEGGTIPYTPAAAAQKVANYKDRKNLDPLNKCWMPGVPRIMYMEHPFQIFQDPTHVAMAFEFNLIHRMIYTDGKPAKHPFESFMGDARGKWEGDTLVVTVTDMNDRTWLDAAGDHHSDKLKVTERYTLLDADTLQYEATLEDPNTYTRPWKISMPIYRQKGMDRVLEYQCQAEKEEENGDFERDLRTWYPEPGTAPSPVTATANMPAPGPLPDVKIGANVKRGADGKPDISGYFNADAGGANYGLEKHARDSLTPQTRGVIIDPPDGQLPYKDWSKAERTERELPHRGYDDPTAHCFVSAGVPRSMYVPSPFHVLQTPGYVVILHERMSWRIIPLTRTQHLPDTIRLWQGDSIGHWEGDVLVVDTTNMNGRTWLNEVGEVVSHMEHITERFIPADANKLMYRATVSDPIPYTKPWTIEMALNKEDDELLEVACLEDNNDLQHLKDVRDEYRAKQKK